MVLRKVFTSTIAAVCLTSTLAFSASEMDVRVSRLEKQMQEVRTETAINNYGALTAPARDEIDGNHWSILIGPVYYTPRLGGTDFTYTDQDPLNTLPVQGRMKDMSYNWDWGIRAAIGYNLDHDSWDASLNYLWFSTSGSKNVNPGSNSVVSVLRSTPFIVGGCAGFSTFADRIWGQVSKSQFSMDYNGLDLEVGRDFFVSKMLALRPFMSVKAVWLDLEQVSRYSGGQNTQGEETGLGVNNVDVRDESDMIGVGPRVGIDSRWYYGCGWCIYGNASASILYGTFDVDHREKFSPCQKTNRVEIDANQQRFVPNAQLMFGIRYNRFFKENCQAITLRLGYDVQYFWRANQFLKPEGIDAVYYERFSEDVGFHGVSFDAMWSF